MTQKRRRSDSPQGSARTMPSPPSNANRGRDPSLEAAVRALLAEDEPEARPPARHSGTAGTPRGSALKLPDGIGTDVSLGGG